MALHDLADAARKSGLTVVELPGWQTRTRPGSFAPRGVLVHHTGGDSDTRAYVDWMALQGRSDLPAPLCQLALSRTGVVYVCAGGRANHGGTAKASGPMPAGDANALYIGIEALNNGSEGWTATQYAAYVALCAALCEHYGWPATHVRAHRETSVTGKWDPGRLDMDQFRTDIANHQGDDMPLSPEDKQWIRVTIREQVEAVVPDIAKAVLNADVIARLDVSVREALRDVVDKSAHRATKEK